LPLRATQAIYGIEGTSGQNCSHAPEKVTLQVGKIKAVFVIVKELQMSLLS